MEQLTQFEVMGLVIDWMKDRLQDETDRPVSITIPERYKELVLQHIGTDEELKPYRDLPTYIAGDHLIVIVMSSCAQFAYGIPEPEVSISSFLTPQDESLEEAIRDDYYSQVDKAIAELKTVLKPGIKIRLMNEFGGYVDR